MRRRRQALKQALKTDKQTKKLSLDYLKHLFEANLWRIKHSFAQPLPLLKMGTAQPPFIRPHPRINTSDHFSLYS